METKCAKCKTPLKIECPLCYIAKIDGRFFCLKCYFEEKAKK